jgi:hypothetical protein
MVVFAHQGVAEMRRRILLSLTVLVWMISPACSAGIELPPTALATPTQSLPTPTEFFPTPTLPVLTTSSPICPELPRPAALFRLDEEGTKHMLYHPASDMECTFQFDPPISRVLALTSGGVYYTTVIADEDSATEQALYYANDGTVTLLPYIKQLDPSLVEPLYLLVSPDGSHIVWSQIEAVETTGEGEEYVSKMYSADVNGNKMRLLYSQNSMIEANIMVIPLPLRFTDDGSLLFAIDLIGKGGHWLNFTGRYSNLYRMPAFGGEATLLYECPEDDISDCIGDISANGDYFVVTDKDAGEIIIYNLEGSPVATYSGPGQDHIGHPLFSPEGALVFMSVDVRWENGDVEIEQGYVSYIESPSEEMSPLIFTEPVMDLGAWIGNEYILCASPDKFIVDLQGNVRDLPVEPYSSFLGVWPQ